MGSVVGGLERLHTTAGADVERIDVGEAHREVGQRHGRLRDGDDVFPAGRAPVLPIVGDEHVVGPPDAHRRLHMVVAAGEQAGVDQVVDVQWV